MNEIRRIYLDTAHAARDLVSSHELAEKWDAPSALEHFSLKGLAGHLARAVISVETYLDRPIPPDAPVTAAEYYARALGNNDLTSDLHTGIRQRGEQMAAEGHRALLSTLDGAIARLRMRLDAEPEERRVQVFKDIVIFLDDYLVTRLVELVVHMDDLSVSLGIQPPAVPTEAYGLAEVCLVDIARFRHGDVAVIRALARRERDAAEALRVL